MKAIIVSHNYPNNLFLSSGTFVRQQVKELKKLGVIPYIVRPIPIAPWPTTLFNKKWKNYAKMPNTEVLDDIEVFYPKYVSFSKFNFHVTTRNFYRCLSNSIKNIISNVGKIDIIHAHFIIPDGFASSLIGMKLNIPVVTTAHGSDVNLYERYTKKEKNCFDQVIRKSNAIITVSNALKHKVEQYSSPQYVESIPMGVDTGFFSPVDSKVEIRKQLGIPENANILLFVGHITKEKGIFDLLQAINILKNKDLNFLLVIVGSASSYKELFFNISQMKLETYVKLVGEIPHSEVKYWMSASDIFILPSYSEGLPTVVVEAMACGLAVIATPVGGIPEILLDNENGIIVPVKEPDILAKKIELIIDNPDKKMKYGLNARETVMKQYDVKLNAQRVLNLYNKFV